MGFKKMMQLLSHKSRVRWERILREVITDFHEVYVDIMLASILNLSASNMIDPNPAAL